MALLKIENDQLKNLGDAQRFLREIVVELDRGYKSGYGWELDVNAEIPEPPKPVVVLDKNGVELKEGDEVFAEQGIEDVSGQMIDAYATIESIDADGTIKLHSDEHDLVDWSFEGNDLVKQEKKEPTDADEEKDAPWNKHATTPKGKTQDSTPADSASTALKG